MGALAHFLEDEGIATTGISLVREHTEQMRPPRFLWVPFILGRPLGAPDDSALQRRVLLATLTLLDADHGPVLEDFPEDAPAAAAEDSPAMVCPVSLPQPETASDSDLATLVQQEITQLAPWYELAVATRGRTTVGLSGRKPHDVGQFLAGFLNDELPESYQEDLALGEALKLTCEDLKAYYLEAATAQPGTHSSTAVADWFWRQTAAGQLLRTLQPHCAQSSDRSVRLVAQGMFVPRAQSQESR